MRRKLIAPMLFGLVGASILIWLGTWQVQRLNWKQEVLTEINAKIGATPVALPDQPDAVTDQYLPVTVSGVLGEGVLVLASTRDDGPGYRIIRSLNTDGGRRVLVDLGFRRIAEQRDMEPAGVFSATGNLHWPDEVDRWTPAPELETGLWFARDVPNLAGALGTEETLVVVRKADPQFAGIRPMPVSSTGIPNKHFEYAVTWYLFAVVWLGMTGLLLWRIRRKLD